MKYVKNIMVVLMIGLFVSGTAFAADLKGGLTVESESGGLGDTVSMGISLDDNDGAVAGLAFTLTYDSTALTFAGLEAVASQALLDPEGETAVDADTLYYQANDATAGEVMIAAASASAVADGTVLKVKFTVADDAEATDYDIGIKKSTISNAAAGYDTPTEIDPLVGLPEGDEFKDSVLTGGKLTVSSIFSKPGEIDGIGYENGPDVNDLFYLIDIIFNATEEPPSDQQMAAANVDGEGDTPDVNDVFALIDIIFGG